jgi:hypothetical protein
MQYKLRKWNEADLNSLVKYANNRNIAKWLTNGFPHPYTQDDGKAYLSIVVNDNPTKVFAIDVNGEAVGSIGLYPQTDIHEKSAEIGYWLAESFWGQGIMVKAIQEVVEYGFQTFDIVRIFARPFPEILKGEYELVFEFDIEALLKYIDGTVTKKAIAKASGINAVQLSHYSSGLKKPRKQQREKIVCGLHKIAKDLLSVT